MTLSFTAIDKKIQFRDFSCQLTDLDGALNILSKITAQGSKILTAYIIDEGKRIELPIEAFDGEPFADPMHQLEKQWQAILSEPVRSALAADTWRIDLTRQRIKIFDERIAQFTLLIARFEQFRQRLETTHDAQRKDKLMRHYDTSLKTYQQYVDRAKASQQVAQKKLAQLQRKITPYPAL